MKRLALLSCVAVLAIAQTPVRHGEFVVSADRQQLNGSLLHLIGHVRIESDAVLLQAEDVNYNRDTQELVAQGEVHVKLK
jgi:lipopolysaccharide assembly outer membrane protein LptD (OstA)